jgi:cell pole-organizing protein PopZ
MEDILSSIRRIIADNGRTEEAEPAGIPAPPAGPETAPSSAPLLLTQALPEGGSVLTLAPGEAGQGEVIAVEEPLLLTQPVAAEAPAPPEKLKPPPPSTPRRIRPVPHPVIPPAAAPSPVAPARVAPPASPASGVTPRPAPEPAAPPPAPPETARSGRTLEEVVREALEPMLRAWLDRNLQEIVERRVQQEIDRISRKSES